MNRDRLLAKVFEAMHAPWSQRDTMLYALGVGACTDPLDPSQLRHVYEKDLQALSSMCCVLAHPGGWLRAPELAVDWVRLLHAEQRFELRRPLPAEGEVVGRYEVAGILDKGAASGALLYLRNTLRLPDGEVLGTVGSTYFLRGDGGCGNWGTPDPELKPLPETAPDGAIDLPTLEIAALIYRLSGDYNPLHADPAVAAKAGFDKPILHGLCTYGVACLALVRAVCGNNAEALRGMSARFTKPVFPGETIRTEWWGDGSTVRFRCSGVERGLVVLDRGSAQITI